jgi:hypothetical protein
MKKIVLIIIHFVILCWAAGWCFKLATKPLPHSGSTVEQWRQKVTQITNVTELHQKSVQDQDYILRMESLFERLRWITVSFAAVLAIYSLVGIIRSVQRKHHDHAA